MDKCQRGGGRRGRRRGEARKESTHTHSDPGDHPHTSCLSPPPFLLPTIHHAPCQGIAFYSPYRTRHLFLSAFLVVVLVSSPPAPHTQRRRPPLFSLHTQTHIITHNHNITLDLSCLCICFSDYTSKHRPTYKHVYRLIHSHHHTHTYTHTQVRPPAK